MKSVPHSKSQCDVQELLNLPKIEAVLGSYRHLRRLNVYVDENISRSFQLPEAAATIGVSHTRLSHLFAEKTGIPYSKYIRHKRIRRASELLSSDDRPILDVAISAGFSSIRTFERSFKNTIGLTPSEYRRQTILLSFSQK